MNTAHSAPLFVQRLDRLDDDISRRLSLIDKATVAFPTVGVALIGVTQQDSPSREIQQVVYTSLVLLATGMVFYAVVQMRTVFIYAGQRRAIEEYAELDQRALPTGLFTWERGPALEISGPVRLDGKSNLLRYIQPVFLLVLDVGMCGFGLAKLQSLGIVTFWFSVSCLLTLVSLVMIIAAFWIVPSTMTRVYEWCISELRKNAVA